MEFREWLMVEDAGSNQFSKFIKSDGSVTLYHYLGGYQSGNAKPSLVLDPKRFGSNMYTRNDVKVSPTPKVFFYLDIREKEPIVNGTLYKATVKAKDIYNVLSDPDKFKDQVRQQNNGVLAVGWLINLVAEKYAGMYYNPGFNAVCWFHPIKAELTDEQEVLKGLRRKSA